MNATKTIVIYHGNCADGLGAAWVYYRYIGSHAIDDSNVINNVIYHGTNERNFYLDKRMPDIDGANVIILDYSYNANTMFDIAERASSVTLIDHHKTAKEGLSGCFNNSENKIIISLEKSAAQLAWEYYFPNVPEPLFISYIGDRDLWKWELPMSQEFSTAYSMEYGMSFEVFDSLYELSNDEIMKLCERGAHYKFAQDKIVKKISSGPVCLRLGDYNVVTTESRMFQSEIGNYLSEKYQSECDFAVVWFYIPLEGKFVFSLRASAESEIDLSAVAKKYGGGGHPKASGFTYIGSFTDLFSEIPQVQF